MALYHDGSWLHTQYHERQLFQFEIAALCKCNTTTITKWMKRLHVPVRAMSDVVKKRWKDNPQRIEEARNRMVGENNPARSFAARKKISMATRGRVAPAELRERISNTLKAQWSPSCTKEFLEKIYIKKAYSLRDIERIYGWNHNTIYRWFKNFNIPLRKQSYWHGKEECVQNFNTNPYGKGWTRILKKKIKWRDNYLCQFCKIDKKNHLIIHHLDENKNNHSSKNLVTLCMNCHGKIHRSKVCRDEFLQMKSH